MLPSDHFVLFYNEIFKFLQRRGQRDLDQYYERVADRMCFFTLDAFKKHGLKGMYDYWERIRIEENCGMETELTEDHYRLRMTRCPSLSKVIDNDAGPCRVYCDHCPGWILRVIDRAGYWCVYDLHSRTEPVCDIWIYADDKLARAKHDELSRLRGGDDLVKTNLPAQRPGGLKQRRCVLLTLAAALSLTASARTPVRFGACGQLAADGIEGRVVAHARDWRSVSPHVGTKPSVPDPATMSVDWQAELPGELSLKGMVSAQPVKDEVAVSVQAVSAQDSDPQCVAYSFTIDPKKVRDCAWRAETPQGIRRGTFARKADDGRIGMLSGEMRSFAILEHDGRERLVWRFPKMRSATLQDGRKWHVGFTFRIGAKPPSFRAGEKVDIAFSLSAGDGIDLQIAKKLVIRAGDDWIPLKHRKDIVAGSALDFSRQIPLDAPAGKLGWLRNVDGHFEFEKSPGVQRRFCGVNLCFDANYPDHALADALIERFRRLGYNAIRIHHYEHGLSTADNWDRLDYLVAKGIERGFYFTTDLYVSRTVRWQDIGLAERSGGAPLDKQHYKALIALWDPAYENWKRFADAFFAHVNPYTGRSYAAEPALPLVALVNEGQLTMGWMKGLRDDPILERAYRAWLAERRKADAGFCPDAPAHAADLRQDGEHGAALALFMADIERRSARRMKDHLRSIGVKALITNANNGPHPLAMIPVRHELYDYVDNHFYVDHPHFHGNAWGVPSSCGNLNPAQDPNLSITDGAFTHVAGLPMCITEWNFSGPGEHRGAGGLMSGAFAALQDYGGQWRFAYAHHRRVLPGDSAERASYFDLATDALSQMGDFACVCLFLRGDLERASASYAFAADPSTWGARGGEFRSVIPRQWRFAAWDARFATTVKGLPVPPNTQVLDLDRAYASPTPPFQPDAMSTVRLDRDRGAFAVNTRRTSGGFAPDGPLDCGRVSFSTKGIPATVWVSDIDSSSKGIRSSRRLVAFHLTDLQSEGTQYLDETRRVLLQWGNATPLVRNGTAKIAVRLDDPTRYDVWALRTDGSRIAQVPTHASPERLSFDASVKGLEGACLAYEIVQRH